MSEEGGRGFGTLGFQEVQARELSSSAGFSQFEVSTFDVHMRRVRALRPQVPFAMTRCLLFIRVCERLSPVRVYGLVCGWPPWVSALRPQVFIP